MICGIHVDTDKDKHKDYVFSDSAAEFIGSKEVLYLLLPNINKEVETAKYGKVINAYLFKRETSDSKNKDTLSFNFYKRLKEIPNYDRESTEIT